MSTANMWNNRPSYRFGGHIELTRFKGYLRIRSSILAQYLRALFGEIFHKVFLGLDCNGKKDRCTVFGCNNDRHFSEIYMVKDYTSFVGGTFLLL